MSQITIPASLISPIWEAYKSNFGSIEFLKAESYKWPVLKQVYEKWNWNTKENSASMFEQAFKVKGQKNLWSSIHFYPITMFTEMVKELPKEANEAMNFLLDESISLEERLNIFPVRIEEMRIILEKLHPSENKGNHFHGDLRAASLYLTLQYPQKYFLYKSSIYNKLTKRLNIRNQAADSKGKFIHYIQLARDLKAFIQCKPSAKHILQGHLDASTLRAKKTWKKKPGILSSSTCNRHQG